MHAQPLSVATASSTRGGFDSGSAPFRRARTDALGWFSVALLTLVVATTWAPMLDAAFGDNHEGRIMARYALHMRNLHERGLLGSDFSADWEPFYSSSYAHHPPLLNILDAVFTALPGEGEYQIRLAPYLLGLLAIPTAAALLRAFGLRWVPVLLSLGLMVATGLYWLYGRIVYDLGTVLAMSAAIAHLRRRESPPAWLIAIACTASVIAVLGTWLGIAAAAVLGLWLLQKRGMDRATVAVGISMVLGTAVSLAFVVGVSGLSVLIGQSDYRTTGGQFTTPEFFGQVWLYLRKLLPVWYLALLPFGVLASLLDRRTRFFAAFSTVLAIGWIVGLPNGSYIHDYWSFVLLIPGVVGMAVLIDRLWQRLPRGGARMSAAAGGTLLALAFGQLVMGPSAAAHLSRPTRAGELVRSHGPAPGQTTAWFLGVPAVRWLAYYWDLRHTPVTEKVARSANPNDLVVVRLDRMPQWAATDLSSRTVARDGRYALVRMGDLHPDSPSSGKSPARTPSQEKRPTSSPGPPG
jgi:hypothetical protein